MGGRVFLVTCVSVILAGVVTAELQQVEVGGQVRIRGNYMNLDSIERSSFIEQRSRVNVLAHFTQDVSAFIELDNYLVWGDKRGATPPYSWYLCGNDFRESGDSMHLYQAYIEARNMWGTNLTMRVGRQEIELGNQFLIGNNDTSALFYGRSYDALRLTYGNEDFSIDAIAAKLTENYSDFGEDDMDLYTLYGSYRGIDNHVLDAYWIFVRDDDGTVGKILLGAGEVNLHTIGLRGAGVIGGFDYELEGAYQFGTVYGLRNPWFRIFTPHADVQFDEFAVNAEAGYTFDVAWQPRLFGRFAYLGGGQPNDSRWNNDRTMPFSRLFSNIEYSEFLDGWTGSNGALSNAFVYALGLQAQPTSAVSLKLLGSYLRADQPLTRRHRNRTLGWEVGLYSDYAYSEDLTFRAGYAHFFGKAGLETAPVRWSGLIPWQGDRKDDYDYLFLETELAF